jgi:prepilin-type N-terminal cleavage/methylation domain-containing protein
MKIRKRAFTLVELLVVISILVLLMSMLLPALNKAKEHARRTVCSSNLHQLGLAQQCYASDHRNWIPRYVNSVDYENGGSFCFKTELKWGVFVYLMHKPVYDYIKKSYGFMGKSWVCPSLTINKKAGMRSLIVEKRFRIRVKGEFYDFERGDLYPSHTDAGSAIPQPAVFLGYANLAGLHNMGLGTPESVKSSAYSVTDGGDRVLASDLNLRWTTWYDKDSLVGHVNRNNRMPAGSNCLKIDGHVEWHKPSVMGWEDEPVTELGPGKYKMGEGLNSPERWNFW